MEKIIKRLFQTAPIYRAYLETFAVYILLTLFILFLYGEYSINLYAISILFLINPTSALWYALRLRPFKGTRLRQTVLEIGFLALPGMAIYIVSQLIGAIFDISTFVSPSGGIWLWLLFIGVMIFPFLFFRGIVRLWVWWSRFRQRRLIWSLVHSHLITVGILQAIVVVPAMVLFAFTSSTFYMVEGTGNPITNFVFRIQMTLPFLGLAILAATVILMMLLPVSVVVSYFFARRLRGRLDALLDVAHAAGDGNYEVRVPVTGEDEIAKLQADFNVMIGSLSRTVTDLRAERETVQALLNSRRELIASVSHELRTPIATIRAYLESAKRQNQVTITGEDAEIIEREILRLQSLIDDLFALSRAEVDQLVVKSVPSDAAALVERVVETVAPLAWRVNKVEVLTSVPRWLPQVNVDEARLEQVLRNLIHNALRYTPPGGLIILNARYEGNFALIEVRDTGSGIAPEELPHIWERYYRDSKNGGAGLGLTLVKSFTEAMGGRVEVESTPGEGSVFTLYLPIAGDAPEETELPIPATILRQI
jgi:signal transduction histidine kinase